MLRIFGIVAVLSSPALAATPAKQAVLVPALDAPASATAGSQIFERSNGLRYEAVKVDGSATKMTDSGRQTIEAGQLLFVDTDAGKLTACLAPDQDVLCLTDKDKDGRFDVVNTWIGLFPKKLPEPIPYSRGFTLLAPNAENTFKQTLTFLGMTGPTLRLSYREFINDMGGLSSNGTENLHKAVRFVAARASGTAKTGG